MAEISFKKTLVKKIGNSQLFKPTGEIVPVTVCQLLPGTVVGTRPNGRVWIGFRPIDKNDLNKPERGQFKGLESGYKTLVEWEYPEAAENGSTVKFDIALEQKVKVTGTSKGKGFQGVMKKFGFGGTPASHGHGPVHRHGGSTGNRTTPGRTFKGRKMPGHLGVDTICVRNLKVAHIEGDLLFIKGALPGARGAMLKVEVMA